MISSSENLDTIQANLMEPPPEDLETPPPFLADTEALELEQVPLQLALLTMEVERHRKLLLQIIRLLTDGRRAGEQ